ncbi:nucleotide-binding protein-like protein containing TIR -like domain [Methylobacterium sp. 4-46]|uniref:TIR domain-containing protein n=1 Tax=unclassified Methylobacterium TaxID=2615210 RepID=UPI000165CB58|nr:MULTISPECIES: nucleotide-binding protein [Methylobacterium]ACA19281.1 nucleotide-binding protein-like protein containing TIR -like domain [Methylobacterium sp. 4-46]WFT78485.1 nucleotide-binding protein [Methylobacterium nodulans]
MSSKTDVFTQINNAVLDLQGAHLQGFERPLKTLARLLQSPDLQDINRELTSGVDYEGFIAASEATIGGMVGSGNLVWPEDQKQTLGLTLILIEKLAAEPGHALNFAHNFFYSGNKLIAGLHSLVGQVLIPFARDYKAYVLSRGDVQPRLVQAASNKVFIVHGHDDAALQGLARFIEKLGLEAIVLKEQPDQGRTIIEKFEQSATDVGYAVVLLTPDDMGGAKTTEEQDTRARQNVIFELGYFAGRLGRGRVCLLKKGRIEIPSDLFGVIYTEMDPSDGWKARLVGELKAAKLDFDANSFWR